MPMPYGFNEYQPNPDVEDALTLQRLMGLAGYPAQPEAPVRQPSPGLNIGPVHLSGDRLDAASAAVLAALQNAPQARSGGGAFVQGLAGGMAGARTRAAAQRKADYEAAKERADRRNEASQSFRASAVRSIQDWREAKNRDASKPTATGHQMSEAYIDTKMMTPEELEAFKKKFPDVYIPPDGIIHRSSTVSKAQQAAMSLSPDAVRAWGEFAAQTGQLPALGMGQSPVRAQLLEAGARSLQGGASIAGNRADYRALSGSLGNIRKLYDNATAYEATALKNSAVLEQTLKTLEDTGSPLLNAPLRQWSGKARGSAEIAAFKTARQVVVPEFARLLNSPTMSGVLTNEARHEINQILDPNATIGQIVESLRILKIDAANRKQSYSDQLNQIRGEISGQPMAPAQEAAPAAPAPGVKNAAQQFLDELARSRSGKKKP